MLPGLFTFSGHHWKADAALGGPVGQVPEVEIPDALPLVLDFITSFELGEKESGQKIGWQVTGTKVDPGCTCRPGRGRTGCGWFPSRG